MKTVPKVELKSTKTENLHENRGQKCLNFTRKHYALNSQKKTNKSSLSENGLKPQKQT